MIGNYCFENGGNSVLPNSNKFTTAFPLNSRITILIVFLQIKKKSTFISLDRYLSYHLHVIYYSSSSAFEKNNQFVKLNLMNAPNKKKTRKAQKSYEILC